MMSARMAILVLLLHQARCSSYSHYAPLRRYHPGKFNSNNNDDLEPAEDVQYAYSGGESHTGEVDLTQGHTGVDFTQTHTGANLIQGHTGVDLTQSQLGHVDPNDGKHNHQVDLTSAGSTAVEYSAGHGYSYPEAVEAHGYSGYHYDKPHGYEYLPPPTGHVIEEVYHTPVEAPIHTPPVAKATPSYTYYYLGRHLWYIPLYFSIYFILYVGALVLKSIARHKILFPENLKIAAHGRALEHLNEGRRKFYM